MLVRICIGTIRRPLADLVDCVVFELLFFLLGSCCFGCCRTVLAKLLSEYYAYAPMATLSFTWPRQFHFLRIANNRRDGSQCPKRIDFCLGFFGFGFASAFILFFVLFILVLCIYLVNNSFSISISISFLRKQMFFLSRLKRFLINHSIYV